MGNRTIELSDLECGIQREFSITPSFLRFILSREMAGDQQTLDECMSVAADFTAVTYRELAIVIYSQLPKDPKDYKSRRRLRFSFHKLAVPNLGTMSSVINPKLEHVVYNSFVNAPGETRDAAVYVPIVHLHTHPGKLSTQARTFPSIPDLINTRERYKLNIDVAGISLRMINPELQVISTSGGFSFSGNLPVSSQLFYQFTGNERAFDAFLNKYDALLEECSSEPKIFAQKMQRGGAFKTEYFGPGELVESFDVKYDVKREIRSGIKITQKNENKLVKKFAYTLKIYRPY